MVAVAPNFSSHINLGNIVFKYCMTWVISELIRTKKNDVTIKKHKKYPMLDARTCN